MAERPDIRQQYRNFSKDGRSNSWQYKYGTRNINIQAHSICCHLTPVMEPVPIFSFNLITFCSVPTSLCVNTNIPVDISPYFAKFVCFFFSGINSPPFLRFVKFHSLSSHNGGGEKYRFCVPNPRFHDAAPPMVWHNLTKTAQNDNHQSNPALLSSFVLNFYFTRVARYL